MFISLSLRFSDIFPIKPWVSSRPTPLVFRNAKSFLTAMAKVSGLFKVILWIWLKSLSVFFSWETYRMTELAFMDIPSSVAWASVFSIMSSMTLGFSEMPCPTTVISATGELCAISASSSVAKAPVIRVPFWLKSPLAWLITLTGIDWGLYLRALLWMNLAPESAKPTRVVTSISGSLSGSATIFGSPDIIPSALVTRTTSSAFMAWARMNAVVSLPPRPRVVILSSRVLPMKPAITGTVPVSMMGRMRCWIRFSHSSRRGLALEKFASVIMGHLSSSGSR